MEKLQQAAGGEEIQRLVQTEPLADPRLVMALELLSSALEQSSAGQRQAGDPAPISLVRPSTIPTGLMSATDLLSWWNRPASSARDPWDEYFDRSFHLTAIPIEPTAERPARRNTNSRRAWARAQDAEDDAAAVSSPWINLRGLVAEPEEQLADDQAEAAVECLYAYIHAIGRRDVDAAMGYIANDFHVFEQDREVDKAGWRAQIESLLDSLHGWEFEISLAELPIPVFHPNGILIYSEIQIEARDAGGELHRSIVEPRVAVLEQRSAYGWVISALSPV